MSTRVTQRSRIWHACSRLRERPRGDLAAAPLVTIPSPRVPEPGVEATVSGRSIPLPDRDSPASTRRAAKPRPSILTVCRTGTYACRTAGTPLHPSEWSGPWSHAAARRTPNSGSDPGGLGYHSSGDTATLEWRAVGEGRARSGRPGARPEVGRRAAAETGPARCRSAQKHGARIQSSVARAGMAQQQEPGPPMVQGHAVDGGVVRIDLGNNWRAAEGPSPGGLGLVPGLGGQ